MSRDVMHPSIGARPDAALGPIDQPQAALRVPPERATSAASFPRGPADYREQPRDSTARRIPECSFRPREQPQRHERALASRAVLRTPSTSGSTLHCRSQTGCDPTIGQKSVFLDQPVALPRFSRYRPAACLSVSFGSVSMTSSAAWKTVQSRLDNSS